MMLWLERPTAEYSHLGSRKYLIPPQTGAVDVPLIPRRWNMQYLCMELPLFTLYGLWT